MTDAALEERTEELYARPPATFVARRDALAKAAKAAGERELASAIAALRRPTTGAWYLNTAARAGLVSLRELLHLGEDLRAAQSGGDFATVRTLAARRNPLVARVVRDLVAHLAATGTTATAAALDEVRATLAGALADPDVAALVARGRLDGPRAYAGFGSLPDAGPGASEGRGGAQREPRPEDDEGRGETHRDDSEREAARREREALRERRHVEQQAASADLAAATGRHRDTADEASALRQRVAELTASLARARTELAAAERRLTGTRAEVERARARVAAAADRSGSSAGAAAPE